METTTNKTPSPDAHAETIGDSLADLGAAWARYGLRAGLAALESQSKNLEACGKALGEALATTAKTLAQMADSFERAHTATPARPGDDAVEVSAEPHPEAEG